MTERTRVQMQAAETIFLCRVAELKLKKNPAADPKLTSGIMYPLWPGNTWGPPPRRNWIVSLLKRMSEFPSWNRCLLNQTVNKQQKTERRMHLDLNIATIRVVQKNCVHRAAGLKQPPSGKELFDPRSAAVCDCLKYILAEDPKALKQLFKLLDESKTFVCICLVPTRLCECDHFSGS